MVAEPKRPSWASELRRCRACDRLENMGRAGPLTPEGLCGHCAAPADLDPAARLPEKLALSPKEAAESLGVSTDTLLRWERAHGLPAVRLGQIVLYPVEGLRRWLARFGGYESP